MLLTSILLLTGLILLVYASDRIVYGAAVFSRALGISPLLPVFWWPAPAHRCRNC